MTCLNCIPSNRISPTASQARVVAFSSVAALAGACWKRPPAVSISGRPLISATKYERAVLRCSDCFRRYVADLPEGVKEDEKFDETADVAIALYKYSGGMPFCRQARMQESCGVPLPESVQFE